MIIIAGSSDFDPAQRATALEAASVLFDATRAQDGCLAYVWCPDPADDARVWVYERWRDEASLAVHLAGPCYAGTLKALSGNGLRGADVAKYRIDLSGPVYDSTMRPRADFFEA